MCCCLKADHTKNKYICQYSVLTYLRGLLRSSNLVSKMLIYSTLSFRGFSELQNLIGSTRFGCWQSLICNTCFLFLCHCHWYTKHAGTFSFMCSFSPLVYFVLSTLVRILLIVIQDVLVWVLRMPDTIRETILKLAWSDILNWVLLVILSG